MTNQNLRKAKREKNDEFYTQLVDIENELQYYTEHFRNKIVYCNCDNPEWSNFWKYFHKNFTELGLKKIIATYYSTTEQVYMLEYSGGDDEDISVGVKTFLKEDGDFRSSECIEFLKQADIVVTNPPFSLFREYIAQLMEYNKKFLIIGNLNNVTYKEFFQLIKDNRVWMGMTMNGTGWHWFRISDDYDNGKIKVVDGIRYATIGSACWWTNLDNKKRHEDLILYKTYNEEEYPKYDNYDAIEVSKTVNIPCGYNGVMGVPITFVNKYNPNQFEILGDSRYHDGKDIADDINILNGKQLYRRLLIRKR